MLKKHLSSDLSVIVVDYVTIPRSPSCASHLNTKAFNTIRISKNLRILILSQDNKLLELTTR